jgi:hypothetical protein
MTGKTREVPIEIYYDYGVDDIGMNIDFLVESKTWTQTKQTIDAIHFKTQGTRKSIIKYIEEDYGREIELRKIVGQTWNQIEEAIKLNRVPKYDGRRRE